MATNTILLLFLSILIAGGLSYFQYYYEAKTKSKAHLVLAFLRFSSIFILLLLLINPIMNHKSLEIIKTPLTIVVDNSSSIVDLKANDATLEVYKKLTQNKNLQEKFEIQTYGFDSDFQSLDPLGNGINFKGTQTNIDEVAKSLKSIYKNTSFPAILISDGNQTSGNDYVYSFGENNAVFPVVVGDTARTLDLKISHLNVNKYAFFKNKFPVEVFINYSGSKSISSYLTIYQGNSVLSREAVSFSNSKKSAISTVLLPADKVGNQVFKAQISSSEKEKNSYNNSKYFAVEVMDQRTNVLLVSAINHPDIGAIKRAIETNAQRKVTIVKPNEVKSLQDCNLLLLYQPTTAFKAIYENAKLSSINAFIVTGTHTDYTFLNQQQQDLVFKMSGQAEDYLASFNPQFNLFVVENFGFDSFPPLQNSFGTIATNGTVSTLLSSKIRNIETNAPLLAFAENGGKRTAFLLGENSWKWRLQSHIETKSYEKYDLFIDKIIQFLTTNSTKKQLVVQHDSFYNSGDFIEISAQYFNKNFEFDEKARLTITVVNTKTKATKNYDLLKANNLYKVNLDGLSAGNYDFSVKELNSKTSYSSRFEILDFEIEKQFVNPDVAKLKELAMQTQGKVHYPNELDSLVKLLLETDNYKAIQKEVVTKTPLIDWVYLLVILVITLASEWFIRKYNGML